MLPALAKLLHSSNAEIHVRALLALGMLIGGNQEYQTQLADINGALPRLLALRLQQDDEDSKHVADGIVAAMVIVWSLYSLLYYSMHLKHSVTCDCPCAWFGLWHMAVVASAETVFAFDQGGLLMYDVFCS